MNNINLLNTININTLIQNSENMNNMTQHNNGFEQLLNSAFDFTQNDKKNPSETDAYNALETAEITDESISNKEQLKFKYSTDSSINLNHSNPAQHQLTKINAKILPMTNAAHGYLSYITQTLYAANSVPNNLQRADISNSGSLLLNSSDPQKAAAVQQDQTLTKTNNNNYLATQTRNNLMSDLKKAYDSQLQKVTYFYSTDDYQIKKLTVIDSEKVNLVLIRDYSLSKYEEKRLADDIYKDFLINQRKSQQTKLIINGKTYRN